MESALARLRAKTDRELGILVARQLNRSRKLAARGAYRDAAKDFPGGPGFGGKGRVRGALMVMMEH